ncbi:hypothetical protein ABZ832_12760 [Streptantibioticus parmotrematis]|uniref:hypothetical protein n=1 Tax=Streptantibioticus parmotrematis TaxID=2873249 RepID=UPI0033C41CFC
MNVQQAYAGVQTVLRETFSGIRPVLTYADGAATVTRGQEDTGQEADRATLSQYRYVRTKVSRAKRGALLGVVERAWKAEGYRITQVDPDPDMPAVYAVTPAGYSVNLAVGAPGNVYFVVGSPEFAAGQGTDSFQGGGSAQAVVPDVDDPFWSH